MNKDNKLTLSTPINELESRLMAETDFSEMKNIVELFNLNIQKKNIIRINNLNNLLDKVYNQIEQRLDKNADNFSNKDLLDYFKTILDTISKSDVSTDSLTAPTIQINLQNNINVLNSEFDMESRKRMARAIKSIINKSKSNTIEEVINIDESDNT